MRFKEVAHLYLGVEMMDEKDGFTWILKPSNFPSNWKTNMPVFSSKPVLRKLSSLTDEEWNDIELEAGFSDDIIGLNFLKDVFLNKFKIRVQPHWSTINSTLIILRKMGVDVDGLIDSNEAIEKV